jgi:hypothetical protein
MDAAAPTFGSTAIEHELAWNSIYCFELRFYQLQDDIEQNSLKRPIEEYRSPSSKNSWINPCGCNNVNEKWKIYTLFAANHFPLSRFKREKYWDISGKNIPFWVIVSLI